MELLEQRPVYLTEPDAERLAVLRQYMHKPGGGSHLKMLEDKIERAELLEANAIPTNVVTMNSQVRVKDLDSREQITYTIVYPSRVDASKNQISILGPLGTALLGMRVGDVAEYKSSAGEKRCKIEKILYQPEAAGDFDR